MLPTFQWTTFDVSGMLPDDWETDIHKAAIGADFRDFPRTPIISREATAVQHIPRGRVHADQVQQGLPWLHQLYRSSFLELAHRVGVGPVMAAHDERYGIVLNVQQGTAMRFECHVDSNSLTALLFLTDHDRSEGGALVIAHDSAAASMAEIDRWCAVLRPQAGHLVFFDGRRNPHYVRPLTSDAHPRVVAVMNYYTESFPESQRPRELNCHLYGDKLSDQQMSAGFSTSSEWAEAFCRPGAERRSRPNPDDSCGRRAGLAWDRG